ncbi:penicillin-binding protein 2 [Stakelama tenebrarum]|uniref:Penicillin-binding protein 2 n=1 Tax=Stakelama tenebrarum TaxID=2711215 RepID=A0A6G6Y6A8_9SPHN|nr:penicillin-binding protein 2 [Sphingosinithalassobacter tenebrarum]QIG80381.1 penicillin-binding protein 2 [Sphingosinithalassobacter tenebrarum]
MSNGFGIVTEAAQSFSFSRRALALGIGQGAVGLVLAGRMTWLAVFENEHYRLLAESNRINLTLTPPRRGWIVDRNGQPVANNRTDFRVDIIPDRIDDADTDAVLAQLRQILSLDDEDIARVRTDLERNAGFQPVPVAENLSWEQYAAVGVRQANLPGVAPTRGFARNYPLGEAVGHLIGYVGSASREQYLEEKDPLLITPGFKLGKDGLERSLEDRLRGTPGAKRVEVTARGKLVRELATRPDRPGDTVKLTIDSGLQEYAARRMADNSGSMVVLDVETGDVLAFVSMPAYDPNSFSDGISQTEWKMLSENDHVPLMNKILQGLYPPGSTVKPMHALALLRNGVSPDHKVHCGGYIQVGNGRFHCWKRGGHGAVDMNTAIAQSCDVYFFQMARELGYDAFAPTVRKLGLGQTFELPFPSQRYGTVPDSAWKEKKYDEDWTVADSINASIGQGYVLANPMQLAVMAARIAGGREVVPRLLIDEPHQPAPKLDIAEEHLEVIRHGMWSVVNGGGTGGWNAQLHMDGVEIAGKTGTAQVRRITAAERRTGVLKDAQLPFKLRDHSLYVCFAPADKPKYAASVVLEHHGHINPMTDAKVIARDVMTYFFDRRKAVRTLLDLEPTWGGDYRTRMAAQEAAFRAAQEAPAPPVPEDAAAAASDVVSNAADANNRPSGNVAGDPPGDTE